jgi:rhodanese-related sulfurtransferase/polyisoprenoid-binding protein YceI
MMSALIDPAELADQLERPNPPVLVDVRLQEDYATAHLPRAKTNCVFEVAFLDRMGEVAPDKGAPVCVYGAIAGSYEAPAAAEKLRRAGYREVLELRDGLEGWKSAGQPTASTGTETKAAPAPVHGWREVDLKESRVEWLGRNLLNKHHGQVAIKTGKLQFDRGQLATGEFTLDMRAITCLDLHGDPSHDVLIDHLLSEDFFDVERFPEARFLITRTQPIPGATAGMPDLAVRGELALKNVARPVAFVATTGITAEGKSAAQAVLSFDRTKWNVLYGSGKYFRNLGEHLVSDLIEIQLRIVTK